MTDTYFTNFYWTGFWLSFSANLAIMYYNFSIYMIADRNYRLLNLTMHPFTGSIAASTSPRSWLGISISLMFHVFLVLIAAFFSWCSLAATLIGNAIDLANTPEKIKVFRHTMRRRDLNQNAAARASIIVNDAKPTEENIKAHVDAIKVMSA